MVKKLYVGNLSYSATRDQLKDFFAEAGEVVDSVVITDRATGRSKGFGFVEFAEEEQAQKAVSLFNGKDFDGRTIKVDFAKPQQSR
ncbi:MAG: RNA-binding protein [Candidatus Shapirobacteria bacterium]|nr:RNA-binding protein [Candidatus Shapirobacteria bacterium]MDD5073588.1 RNA-binding protein [Candidatus Shapirobacteria bacterium]MDD5481341.1 RNA-binding protein [Candidatus Shapirobacteria bacterium]